MTILSLSFMFVFWTVAADVFAVPRRIESFSLTLYREHATCSAMKPLNIVLEIANEGPDELSIPVPLIFIDKNLATALKRQQTNYELKGSVAVLDCWTPLQGREYGHVARSKPTVIKVASKREVYIKSTVPASMLAPGECRIQARLVKDGVTIARSSVITIECRP